MTIKLQKTGADTYNVIVNGEQYGVCERTYIGGTWYTMALKDESILSAVSQEAFKRMLAKRV